MGYAQFLKTRVSSETKSRVHALAEQQLITESVWLKRLVAGALRNSTEDESTGSGVAQAVRGSRDNGMLQPDRDAPGSRVCIRLRPDDRLLLRERAHARGVASATYVSVLLRAHLRHLAPLPKEELVALKRSVAELGAIGRNLNQIARAANRGERVVGPGRDELHAMLKVCEALRDNVKRLIRTSAKAWEIGHADVES